MSGQPRTLILGGARSGKSAHAEALLHGADAVTYVATARPWPGDEDFAHRINEHQRRRPASWVTVDDVDAVDALRDPAVRRTAVLVDDVGTWLTHALDEAGAWELPRGTLRPRMEALVDAVAAWPGTQPLVLVTPEVGLSVIPEHRSARLFRDELGWLNAALAAHCEQVRLIVAGLTLDLK
ncbi:bifunctional adenosylcobinamide kinase/adenosylcobinamide-phosphate guanylyltransferase [Corynebacterium sp. 13CS0277]|uniref:bifunctional adenosylcobinamide kinase/adenosylcobinamide-phosphate guanylyltransferase n=1 Tax=Corynebacterium sp. 13CS0277 TaxID=2071994 RepID=UPI001E3698C7|nr:bifunctional adenosylcobinamide kinase/adenosylcobinamide-phosphate guanylyltransferase [Corynebacterium sp. 13CS0277]